MILLILFSSLLYNVTLASKGVIFLRPSSSTFLKFIPVDNTTIVINSIKHIKDIDIKFVLTLLFICFNTNIFNPLKYIFLFLFVTYNITPAKLKKNNTVPTIARAIGIDILRSKLRSKSKGISSKDLYENPRNIRHKTNVNKYINGFLNFMSSFLCWLLIDQLPYI